MRLYLAVAVLVLAFVAYSDAQAPSFDETLTHIGRQLGEIGKNLAEKARTTFQDIHSSPFAENTRNWLEEQFGKLKERVGKVSE